MGLVESWGTGIRRIMDAAEDYALPIPEFQVFDNMFRVILFRKPLSMQSLEDMLERLGQYQKKLEKASEKYEESIGETTKY